MNEPIECRICGAKVQSIVLHLRKCHQGVSLESYNEAPPEHDNVCIEDEKRRSMEAKYETEMAPIIDLFGDLTDDTGAPSGIKLTKVVSSPFPELVPERNDQFVFEQELLKDATLAFELGRPLYLYGHAGCGKTTLIREICARTGRPWIRVQHTANMEEYAILGQKAVRAGATVFDYGPLAMAMKYGWVYVADEYDYGRPDILALYQPVLEGEPLVIKEAEGGIAERVIKPHPMFRFCATGNTNGSGDEHGLYPGAYIGNSANYERFAFMLKVDYMKPEQEAEIIMKATGVSNDEATDMVDFAVKIREAYERKKMSNTISTRALINATNAAVYRRSWRKGLRVSFINRLSSLDAKIAEEIAQRTFGN